ncbi:nucleotide-binding alpha-beta plait domain-containing protein [Tanacetum coccineum]
MSASRSALLKCVEEIKTEASHPSTKQSWKNKRKAAPAVVGDAICFGCGYAEDEIDNNEVMNKKIKINGFELIAIVVVVEEKVVVHHVRAIAVNVRASYPEMRKLFEDAAKLFSSIGKKGLADERQRIIEQVPFIFFAHMLYISFHLQVLPWVLTAASIKMGRPHITRREIECAELRLGKDGWPEYYDGKSGPTRLSIIAHGDDKHIKPALRRSSSTSDLQTSKTQVFPYEESPWIVVPGIGAKKFRRSQSKEDDVQKISSSVFVTNFPEQFSAKDLWNTCKVYGHVVDTYIPDRRSKIGKRFGFVHFINVFDMERLRLNKGTNVSNGGGIKNGGGLNSSANSYANVVKKPTGVKETIDESFKMVYRGKTCWVRAIKVPGWVPDFEDDCDDDDFESNDGTQVDEGPGESVGKCSDLEGESDT